LCKQRAAILARRANADPADEQGRSDLASVEREMEDARREAYIRDPRYAHWCDSTSVDATEPRALLRALGALGADATYVGCLAEEGRAIWTYAVWGEGAIVVQGAWPSWNGHVCKRDPILRDADPLLDPAKLEAWSETLLGPIASRLKAVPDH